MFKMFVLFALAASEVPEVFEDILDRAAYNTLKESGISEAQAKKCIEGCSRSGAVAKVLDALGVGIDEVEKVACDDVFCYKKNCPEAAYKLTHLLTLTQKEEEVKCIDKGYNSATGMSAVVATGVVVALLK